MQSQTHDFIIMGVFVAIIVVLGLILITVPNVEMVTATIFLSGYLLGSKKGLVVGIVAELLYSLLNPYGVAAPPLLIAQVISMAIAGYTGGILYYTTSKIKTPIIKLFQFGVAGFFLTLLFDFLTTISFAIFMAETKTKIIASIISSVVYGLPFYITHILVNTFIFTFIVPLLIRVSVKIDYFKTRIIVSVVLIGFIIPFKLNATQNRNTEKLPTKHFSETVDTQNFHNYHSGQYLLSSSSSPDTTDIRQDSSDIAETIDQTEMDTFLVDTSAVIKKADFKISILEKDTSRLSQHWESFWHIKKSFIQHTFYKDPGGLISYIPGFYTKNLSYPGQFSTIMMHGMPSKYLTILLDGRPMKDAITNIFDLNLIPVEHIDKVDFQDKSSSLLFNNTINILSECYSDKLPYSRVYFHKGPSDFSDVDVIFGQKINKQMDTLLGFTLKGFSGPLQPQSYEHHIGRAKLQYQLSTRWQFFYSGLYNRVKLHPVGPRGLDGQYATPNARSKQIQYDHTLTIKGNVLNSYYQNLMICLYYSTNSRNYKDPSYLISSQNNYSYLGTLMEVNHQLGNHHISASALIEHDWINSDEVNDKRLTAYMLAIKNDWYYNEKMGIRGKINFNGQTNQGATMNKGGSIFFKLTNFFETNIGIEQFTRYPSLFELYSQSYLLGNPQLIYENIQKANIELKFQYLNSFRFNTKAYVQKINHVIDYDFYSDTLFALTNQGTKKYYGMDLQLRWDLWEKYTIGSNINLMESENNTVYEAPSTMIYAYFLYKNGFFKNDLIVNFKVETHYWGNRWSNMSDPYRFYPIYLKLPKDWIVNALGFFKFGDLEFFIGFENILDREYQLVFGYPMNGRTFHYGLRWQFWE